eukprot:TRINITY_DN22868_c0_g1_i1.p1 TRINITY_DN22868_c0_g1~~TRINITY_DN22868_c0_g1_i1.p1  ORF type:complete len:329 (+),score=101.15 TRINITY_DN22868_c0_g1_i1:199-1185(+)
MATATAAAAIVSPLSGSVVAKDLSSKGSFSATKASAFVKQVQARTICSAAQPEETVVQKAGKAATSVALAALLSTGASPAALADVPRLSFDELQSKTYLEIKGSGIANQCPTIVGGDSGLTLKAGKYAVTKMCFEPTSFTVKAEGTFKGEGESFQKTKLMTRLTYTLDEIEGDLDVAGDKSVKFVEKDGIDYAAVTVQLPGGERVPFLFTIKELVATGKPDAFGGKFLVPSYRGSSFLDPKGRGGSTGYDNAVALPAGGTGDIEELKKENVKDTSSLEGDIVLSVAQTNTETGEIGGVFESIQPSDTDLGAKTPKDVKIQGIWYAQVN